MVRNAINDFVDNLIKEKDVSENDANELKEVIEISSKQIDNENLAVFLKTIKKNIEATDNDIFSEKGINVYGVKSIVDKIALEVRKNQEEIKESKKREELNAKKEIEFVGEEQSRKKTEKKLSPQEMLNDKIEELMTKYPNIGYNDAKYISEVAQRANEIELQYDEAAKKGATKEELDAIAMRMSKSPAEKALENKSLVQSWKKDFEEERKKHPEYTDEEFLEMYMKEHPYLADRISPYLTKREGIYYVKNVGFDYGAETPYEMYDASGNEGYTESGNVTNYNYSYELDTGENPEAIYEEYSRTENSDVIKKKPIKEMSTSKEPKLIPFRKVRFGRFLGIWENAENSKSLSESLAFIENYKHAYGERIVSDYDIESTELFEIAEKIYKEQRAVRAFRKLENKEKNIEEVHPLRDDETKSNKIIEMYFERGMAAFEIYEELTKNGDIDSKSGLCTLDVLDVIFVEARKHAGVIGVELTELIDREVEIDKLRNQEKICADLEMNAYGQHKTYQAEMANSRRNIIAMRIQDLNDENFEMRKIVCASRRKQKEEKTAHEDNSHELKVEDMQVKSFKESLFGRIQIKSLLKRFLTTSKINMEELKEAADVLREDGLKKEETTIAKRQNVTSTSDKANSLKVNETHDQEVYNEK